MDCFTARRRHIILLYLVFDIFEQACVRAHPSPRTSDYNIYFLKLGAKQQTTHADHSVISSAGAKEPWLVDVGVLEERAEQTHVLASVSNLVNEGVGQCTREQVQKAKYLYGLIASKAWNGVLTGPTAHRPPPLAFWKRDAHVHAVWNFSEGDRHPSGESHLVLVKLDEVV